MRRSLFIIVACLALAACGRGETVAPASSTATSTASATTTVGGVTLHTSTIAIADLNDTVATRYGIDRAQEGLMLLVTVRDAAGNGIEPGDLRLTATRGGSRADIATSAELYPR